MNWNELPADDLLNKIIDKSDEEKKTSSVTILLKDMHIW